MKSLQANNKCSNFQDAASYIPSISYSGEDSSEKEKEISEH
jgi:hypothetical protein